jgi:hypothetical protein
MPPLSRPRPRTTRTVGLEHEFSPPVQRRTFSAPARCLARLRLLLRVLCPVLAITVLVAASLYLEAAAYEPAADANSWSSWRGVLSSLTSRLLSTVVVAAKVALPAAAFAILSYFLYRPLVCGTLLLEGGGDQWTAAVPDARAFARVYGDVLTTVADTHALGALPWRGSADVSIETRRGRLERILQAVERQGQREGIHDDGPTSLLLRTWGQENSPLHPPTGQSNLLRWADEAAASAAARLAATRLNSIFVTTYMVRLLVGLPSGLATAVAATPQWWGWMVVPGTHSLSHLDLVFVWACAGVVVPAVAFLLCVILNSSADLVLQRLEAATDAWVRLGERLDRLVDRIRDQRARGFGWIESLRLAGVSNTLLARVIAGVVTQGVLCRHDETPFYLLPGLASLDLAVTLLGRTAHLLLLDARRKVSEPIPGTGGSPHIALDAAVWRGIVLAAVRAGRFARGTSCVCCYHDLVEPSGILVPRIRAAPDVEEADEEDEEEGNGEEENDVAAEEEEGAAVGQGGALLHEDGDEPMLMQGALDSDADGPEGGTGYAGPPAGPPPPPPPAGGGLAASASASAFVEAEPTEVLLPYISWLQDAVARHAPTQTWARDRSAVVLTSCAHTFHATCLSAWEVRRIMAREGDVECPVCKRVYASAQVRVVDTEVEGQDGGADEAANEESDAADETEEEGDGARGGLRRRRNVVGGPGEVVGSVSNAGTVG